MPIAQLGIRYKGKQKIEITRAMLSQVVANFQKRDTGEVPIDYDHAIETAAGSGVPVPAAGWIKSIESAPDRNGILWAIVQWTQKAAGMIRAGEYRYVSPVLDPTVRDNRTGEPQGWTLTSAALTNQPVLQGMPALVLSDRGWVAGAGEASTEGPLKTAVEQALADLESVLAEFFGEVEKRTDQGEDFQTAVMTISRERPDLTNTENHLRSKLKGLGYAADSIDALRKEKTVSSEQDAIAVEISRLTKQKMAANEKLDYATAMRDMFIENRDLHRRYEAARRGALSSPGTRPVNSQLAGVNLEIDSAVKDKIAASEGRMGYGAALSAVLCERPDLKRRRLDGMR
jgi:phage I-like protein